MIVDKRSDRGPGGVCPQCLPFVGKVFIDDVWSGGKRSDGPYPLISTAIEAGLYHPRCKDSHTTYFPGISAPPDDSFTKKDLKEIEEAEKESVKQQNAQLQVEKWQRVADTRLDPENRQAAQERASRWERESERLYQKADQIDDPILRMKNLQRADKRKEIGQNRELRKRFKHARFKDGAPGVKFYEIKAEDWFPGSVPRSHEIIRLQEYTKDGVTYVVDGYAVVMKPSRNELRIAELLRDKIGGKIEIVPKVNIPQGVKTSDYLFHEICYDLKTIEGGGPSTLRDAVKKKKGQSRRFILDLTNSPLTDDDAEKQMHGMFGDKHTAFVEEIVIIRGDKIAKIFRRA